MNYLDVYGNKSFSNSQIFKPIYTRISTPQLNKLKVNFFRHKNFAHGRLETKSKIWGRNEKYKL